MTWSTIKKNVEEKTVTRRTITVEIIVSRYVGHFTLAVSARTCLKKVTKLVLGIISYTYSFHKSRNKTDAK